jgi:hypothetical protein
VKFTKNHHIGPRLQVEGSLQRAKLCDATFNFRPTCLNEQIANSWWGFWCPPPPSRWPILLWKLWSSGSEKGSLRYVCFKKLGWVKQGFYPSVKTENTDQSRSRNPKCVIKMKLITKKLHASCIPGVRFGVPRIALVQCSLPSDIALGQCPPPPADALREEKWEGVDCYTNQLEICKYNATLMRTGQVRWIIEGPHLAIVHLLKEI